MTPVLARRKVLPMILCYALDQTPVNGRTRMQKMFFLFEQEEHLNDYQFQAANYGPFSWRLSSALDFLVSNNLINEKRGFLVDGGEKYEYSLTDEGKRQVEEHLSDDKLNWYLTVMTSLKEKYNNMPLGSLLRLIYSQYPDYAVKSQYEF